MLYRCFDFLKWFPPTRRYIAGLYARFQVFSPGDKKSLVKKTLECAVLIWTIQAAAVITLFLLYPSIYGGALTVLAVSILSNEIISRMSGKARILLMEQFDEFLSDVRHNYYHYRMVEESVADAAETAGAIMKLQAEKICQVLTADDTAEALSEYNDEVSDRFLRMFLALCITVLEYGDKEVDGQLLFLNNIKYLKQEIAVELLKRKELNYRFSGLVWIAVLPVFLLRAIESWALTNLPSLVHFYRGASGIILTAVIYAITWLIYSMLNHLREREPVRLKEYKLLKKLLTFRFADELIGRFVRRNYGRCLRQEEMLRKVGDKRSVEEFVLSRFLTALLVMCGCICLFLGIHAEEKRQALAFDSSSGAVLGLNRTAQVKLAEAWPVLVEKYSGENWAAGPLGTSGQAEASSSNGTVGQAEASSSNGTAGKSEAIREALLDMGISANAVSAAKVAEGIEENAALYRNACFQWYELLVCAAAGAAAYAAGYWLLRYRGTLLNLDMEDEVVQFQSIVLMMMYMDRISIPAVMEMMENFAVVFRPPIQKCMNDYNYGDEAALLELKEECGFGPMKRLADQFLLCDQIGMERAFDEIAVERANFREKRKLDNEMSLSKKTAVGRLVSYIPMALAIGGYLIIPFVSESLSELMRYAGEMNAL